jgi:hypothetical protein
LQIAQKLVVFKSNRLFLIFNNIFEADSDLGEQFSRRLLFNVFVFVFCLQIFLFFFFFFLLEKKNQIYFVLDLNKIILVNQAQKNFNLFQYLFCWVVKNIDQIIDVRLAQFLQYIFYVFQISEILVDFRRFDVKIRFFPLKKLVLESADFFRGRVINENVDLQQLFVNLKSFQFVFLKFLVK